jgi:hypothetical protein
MENKRQRSSQASAERDNTLGRLTRKHYEGGTRLILLDAKIKAMNIGDCRRHTQAKTRAWDVMAFLRAIESFEDLLPLVGRNTRPVVRNANEKSAEVRVHGDANETAFRREFDRIIDEIRGSLDQEVEIALDQNWLAGFEREGDLLCHG